MDSENTVSNTQKKTRVVIICGSSGSGKSTLAKVLKEDHGFIHFEGDAWMYGLDPVEQSNVVPTPEQLEECPEHIAQLREKFLSEYWMPTANGTEIGFDGVLTEFYSAMMGQLAERINSAAGGTNFVLTHPIHEQWTRSRVRDLLRQQVIDRVIQIEFIVLFVPFGVLSGRKRRRLETQAADQGKSLEEFVMGFENTYCEGKTFDERVALLTTSGGIVSERVGEQEENTCEIAIDDTIGIDAMVKKVRAKLGFTISKSKRFSWATPDIEIQWKCSWDTRY